MKIPRDGTRSEVSVPIYQPRNGGAALKLHQRFALIAERDAG